MAFATILALALTPLCLQPDATTAAATGSSEPATSGTSIAALPIVVDGELPEQWRNTADARLAAGMTRGGISVRGPATLSLQSCAEAQCFIDVGTDSDADFVLQSRLRVEADQRDYALVLRVFSTSSGEQVAEIEGSCELCGLEEAVDLVEAKAAAVPAALRQLQLGNASFSFTSNPAGAQLEIDGTISGTTPLRQTLEPGTHRVRATMPGFLPQTFEVQSVEGVNKELQFQLVPASSGSGPETQTASNEGRGMVIGGAVLTGLGVGGIAAGATLLAIDGRPYRSNCEADPTGNCRFLYGTQTAGIVSLALGVASLGAGVALLVVGKRKQQKARKRVSFVPTLGGATLRF